MSQHCLLDTQPQCCRVACSLFAANYTNTPRGIVWRLMDALRWLFAWLGLGPDQHLSLNPSCASVSSPDLYITLTPSSVQYLNSFSPLGQPGNHYYPPLSPHSQDMPSHDTHYKVYWATYEGAKNTDHHALYVDSMPNQDGDPRSPSSGWLFHATGSTIIGMTFEYKQAQHNPIFSLAGKSMTPIGWVSHGKFDGEELKAVCRRIPLPHKQFTLSSRTFPNIPIRHCQHWAFDAIHALCAAGVLEPLTSSDDKTTLYRIH